MKYSLRSLMIVGLAGPPLLASGFFMVREMSLGVATLVIGFALLVLFAAYDFVRGV